MREADEPLMTVEEAAAAIHASISPSYIRAAIRDGRLPAVRHGKRYFVRPDDLRRFARCPDRGSRPASGSAETDRGSSSTAAATTGQALAETAAELLLKPRSRNTSPAGFLSAPARPSPAS